MNFPSYYQLLNIEPTADLETIKKAFRRDIALYHPDKNSSKNTRVHFDLLVEAFDILSNPEKRRLYDTMLETSENTKTVVIEPSLEQDYQRWKNDSKKKSESYWNTSFAEFLTLDIFIDGGLSILFSGTEELLDGLGDSLGDLFDVF